MELNATTRQVLGKSVKSLRREGAIPAEFYGHGMKNQTISVERAAFTKLFKEAGENTVITLLLDGKKQPSIVYDVQRNPVSGEVMHIDFYGVRMDEVLRTEIPVEFTGEAPAVKEKGGVLNKAISEIEVEALPADLPHSFEVDLSGLTELDQSIYVKDLAVPKGVKVLLDPETVIATVTEPAPEEEIAPVVAVDEVKVESEEKAEERKAEKETETSA